MLDWRVVLIGMIITFKSHGKETFTSPHKNVSIVVSTNCLNEVMQFSAKLDYNQVISCYWDFGDATFSSDIKPHHAYERTGIYRVKLNVLYTDGRQSTYEYPIEVKPFPFAYFKHNVVCDGPTNFEDKTKSNYPLKDWIWTTNNQELSETNQFKTILNDGSHNVIMTVKDINGCKDEVAKEIKVAPSPEIQFLKKELCANQNEEIIVDYGVDETNIKKEQLYLNGASLDNKSEITFTTPGKVKIEAYVEDINGCADHKIDSLNILNNTFSTISLIENEGCSPFLLEASLKNSNLIQSSSWFINDVEVSSSDFLSTEIIQNGDYKLYNETTLKNGCVSKSKEKKIKIYPNQAISSIVKTEIINNVPISTIHSSDTSITKTVDWGDGVVEQYKSSVSHKYSDFDEYLVKNKALNEWGCLDSIIHHISLSKQQELTYTQVVSPNQDGYNDLFEIFNNLSSELNLEIYDASGRLVYHGNELIWNLLIGNSIAPSGLYIYKLSSLDNEFPEYKGKFIIQR